MTKVSITGHRKQLQTTIDALHRLQLLDIDSYDGELETGNPFEEAEEFSEMLVEIRSLLSRLPETDTESDGKFDLNSLGQEIDGIKQRVGSAESDMAEVERQISDVKSQRKFFRKLKGLGLDHEDLQGTRSMNALVGRFDPEEFRETVSSDKYEIFEGKEANAVLYSAKHEEDIQNTLRQINGREMNLPETDFSGTPEEIVSSASQRLEELENKKQGIEQDLRKLAEAEAGKLEHAENFLAEKVEKAEAPLDFATTENTFIAEGWIPEEKFDELGNELHRVTGGKVHLQTEPTGEEPPTKYDNNRAVQPFESLTELVNTPKYNELDPSFMLLLTFPLFFGFMIGDAGYGVTTALVFYGGMKMFPAAKNIFKSLMWASFFTILFGLAFGDAFGYVIFGHHSELAAATGIHFFEKIPILFHRAEHLGQVFNMAAIIGFIHINLGFLLGFYNDYVQHDLKEAFLENISWIVLEIGALAWYAFGMSVGAPILLIAVVMLFVGEGAQGIVEIPGLLSNILSYLRIFGVAVAAVSLAAVVNAMAEPLFHMGSPVGFALGTLVLVVGHVFNTFIKIMEGFLQGIRLHYVEMFGRFFEGGGRKYTPFGAKN